MRRAQPLILAMNAMRREQEEIERRSGVNPGRERGVISRFRNWESVPGRGNNNIFMGRSRSFPAPPQIDAIRTQPHTQPCSLTLGYRSQSQPEASKPSSSSKYLVHYPVLPQSYSTLPLFKSLPLSSTTPPFPQNDIESTFSGSSDSDESGSLKVVHASP